MIVLKRDTLKTAADILRAFAAGARTGSHANFTPAFLRALAEEVDAKNKAIEAFVAEVS